MASIQKLDPHVAELIAAGEVVERPASVVKELVENAMDAGASAIVVEIRRGGMGLIRVTDNGCGIPASELPTAFLRHATSKLRTAADLEQIGTLGFRGEALAAISAVSRTEILTRTQEAPMGASLTLEGGVPGRVEEAGAPVGTSICVRDLFYNTPARLKFMKKDSAETAAVNGLMQHLALSHPEISFRFLKDGTEVLHTPGDGKLLSAVYAAQGRDFAQGRCLRLLQRLRPAAPHSLGGRRPAGTRNFVLVRRWRTVCQKKPSTSGPSGRRLPRWSRGRRSPLSLRFPRMPLSFPGRSGWIRGRPPPGGSPGRSCILTSSARTRRRTSG